jgi:hypothetical protein
VITSALPAILQGRQISSLWQCKLHVCHSHTNFDILWKERKAHPLMKETESGVINIISVWSMCVCLPEMFAQKCSLSKSSSVVSMSKMHPGANPKALLSLLQDKVCSCRRVERSLRHQWVLKCT